MDTVIRAMKRLLSKFAMDLAVYFILTWICISIISTIAITCVTKNAYRETELLHLSLSNIPNELLNEKQTMTLLKSL
jgi:hypothetical protein